MISSDRTVAVYGGSFDPIHNGHMRIIRELAMSYDRVIVVPTRLSPFKSFAHSRADLRLEMAKAACKDIVNVVVDSYEITKETNYTIDTLDYVAREYGSSNITLVIGSDCLGGLRQWHRAEDIFRRYKILVVSRPFFPSSSCADLQIQGVDIHNADFVGLDISSSEIPIAVCEKSLTRYVPLAVVKIIEREEMYSQYLYITSRFQEFNLSDKRISHIYATAREATRLAKRYSCPTDKAITASLLHDIAKSLTIEDMTRIGVSINPQVYQLPKNCYHQLLGESVAREKIGITDEDVLHAIAVHTTGALDMSLLDKVVFLADYIEPNRKFYNIDKIRQIGYTDIDLGMYQALFNTVKFVSKDSLHSLTEEVLQEYQRRIYGKESNNEEKQSSENFDIAQSRQGSKNS